MAAPLRFLASGDGEPPGGRGRASRPFVGRGETGRLRGGSFTLPAAPQQPRGDEADRDERPDRHYLSEHPKAPLPMALRSHAVQWARAFGRNVRRGCTRIGSPAPSGCPVQTRGKTSRSRRSLRTGAFVWRVKSTGFERSGDPTTPGGAYKSKENSGS
jgi:hypothetical protein